ncbi:helix-hairpin-helix domain-containing protein [Mitsuaria sp. WAJ17]|uniref:ComEA family DNA-binding protein n=1 Tax=Mitsuaria sp. WAJ17 TaxID=2761452 RepID=UPI001602EA70|nr:helix-hairpin-helix domain-containing protein [Mitsuaria sp. WAJ17]MBB2485604.1 helix-hairpin-helix domain-containing protein [Mitsuaria sp. WAJ17]
MPAWCAPSIEQSAGARRRVLRGVAGLALVIAASGSQGQDLAPSPLELNEASRAELESLQGLGPSLVTRMLAARQQAPFASWQDLAHRVKGMGPRMMARLSAAGLRVNRQALDAAPAAPLRPASSPPP